MSEQSSWHSYERNFQLQATSETFNNKNAGCKSSADFRNFYALYYTLFGARNKDTFFNTMTTTSQ